LIRVSQAWAGANWGGMHIPHVGQEVIVDFIEGDPDRPIITGRVYNANNMPPKKLPDGKQMSIVRDHYGNELVFDATPGDEHIEIYSPHHESRFILGRSTEKFSMGDNRDMVLGDSYTDRRGSDINLVNGQSFTWTRGYSLGAKEGGHVSFQVGTDVSFFGGFKLGINIGTEVNLGLGANVFVGRSTQWNCNWAEYTRATKKDLTLYSSKEAWLCGGENNSIVKCSERELSLSFGKGKPKTDYWDVVTKGAAAGSSVGAICATTMGALRAVTDTQKAHAHAEYQYDDKLRKPVGWKVDPKKVVNDLSPGIGESVSLAAMLAGTFVSTLGKDQDPEQESVNSGIELNANGAYLFVDAKKPEEAKTYAKLFKEGEYGIIIDSDRQVSIRAGKDIFITTNANLHLLQQIKISKDGKKTVLKGKFDHSVISWE
jgi:hypothetical protein